MLLFTADRKTIQNVIDNLQISSLEYRSETDPDVIQYVNDRKVEFIQVPAKLSNF